MIVSTDDATNMQPFCGRGDSEAESGLVFTDRATGPGLVSPSKSQRFRQPTGLLPCLGWSAILAGTTFCMGATVTGMINPSIHTKVVY